ncbi:MAG: DUF4012 domain-containing protein [Jatrophihabitans sp.]|uniref:DUF4012 domain-containing protein n=1 Tax=Jatrophihabitans sp. TaxID=1932789 RepID=UPI003F7D1007
MPSWSRGAGARPCPSTPSGELSRHLRGGPSSAARVRTRITTGTRYLLAGGDLRRRLLIAGGVLALLAVAWLVVTAYLAQRQAAALERRLATVRLLIVDGRIHDARLAAADVPAMAQRIHRLTTGPAWWVTSHIPGLGTPFEELRGTAAATERMASESIPVLVRVATAIDPATLRVGGDTVRLGPLADVARPLAEAAASLNAVERRVDALPTSSWLGPADHARASFAAQLRAVSGYVDAAARVSRILPSMLGGDTPKRYFIGLQNEAEARGTGGLPGAFAIAVVDHGRVHFTHFESDQVLIQAQRRLRGVIDLGREYTAAYGTKPYEVFVDSNASPNFPDAAQIWAAMWQRVSGEHVDGALALDPTVLSYLLSVTGPTVASGLPVTAADVVALTQRDEYALFPDFNARKDFLTNVLKAVSTKVTSGAGAAAGLARAISYAALDHRMLVWSADPAVEREIAATNYAGAIPDTSQPFAGLVLNNAAAGKLDYYVTRALTYTSTGCGSQRDVTVTIALTNNAPASGLPTYVTTREDQFVPKDAKPGDTRTLLDFYASRGALLSSAELNGRKIEVGVVTVLGHPVFRADLELPRATTQTLKLHLVERSADTRPLLVWHQPAVTPATEQIYRQAC